MRKVLLSVSLLLFLFCTACTGDMTIDKSLVRTFISEANVILGTVGEAMHTAWFDFTVNATRTAQEYGGQQPEDNAVFLVADITVTSTIDQDIPLYAADFMLLWSDGFDNALVAWTDTQFPQEYTLAAGETVRYDAVYQVPVDGLTVPIAEEDVLPSDSGGAVAYAIYFQEYFEDDTRGSQYCVTVSPEVAGTAE